MPANKKFYDLTAAITESTVVYPGDPSYQSKDICSLKNGDHFQLCEMQLGNHTGTHIDFPAHVIQGSKTSSDYTLDQLMGDGIIIEVSDADEVITKKSFENVSIFKNDIVFFKTANSKISKYDKFTEKYVSLAVDAAQSLVEQGVKMVGVDYISVDSVHDETLPVHHLLLSNDVLIVEGLELGGVTAGRCDITVAPLRIEDKDGLPARVFCYK